MKVILLELNEINFDFVEKYLKSGEDLPAFSNVLNKKIYKTSSENEYEHLEPWIQWVSAHTGKKFNEHKIFRLGDIVNSNELQIYEKLEQHGFSVGAISPMNTKNNLKNPAYFIPDPWTKTKSDNSFLSKIISSSVSDIVNENANSKISIKSFFGLIISFLILVRPKKFLNFLFYAFSALRKPWRKALFLDKLLHEFHLSLFKSKSPNFSSLFLNAGAHIQHHYFFNSSQVETEFKNPTWYVGNREDPVLEMLKVYDEIIGELLGQDVSLIIATGLSQIPYKKKKFYYRLKNHGKFLETLGINYLEVQPRMSRDFLVKFKSEDLALDAFEMLNSLEDDNGIKFFDSIDNRGKELFILLTYPEEITEKTFFLNSNFRISAKENVSFVAIKNGEHNERGFLFLSDDIKINYDKDGKHVAHIFNLILNLFGIKNP
tara:strand:+ start:6201 stop:7496 length:1296 start_codon:yes stop_codon:yes gene_type:complete